MDVQDGFIVGVFNYCDRWCETCAFSSRCRLFADKAEWEAREDSNLQAIADAPPLPQDIPPPPPRWMVELIDEINKALSEPAPEDDLPIPPPKVIPEHECIEQRAHAYADNVHDWLGRRGFTSRYDPSDPRAVIGWFQYSIPAKAHRALAGLADDVPEDRDWPADHDGSAKVAILGIERSHAAWLQLAEIGIASAAEVAPFIADLIWLSDELERVFPKARGFVRPGFDEPDEVAMLLAADRAR